MDRRLTSGLTLLLLVVVVTAGAVWGYQRLTAPAPDPFASTANEPLCEPVRVAPGERVATKEVTVSVFNGGTRAGLAGRTLGLLADRGFAEGETGNAPDDVTVRGVQIWTESPRNPAVQLVAAHFRGVRIVRTAPLGPGVFVVVGNQFDRLGRGPRSLVTDRAAEICSPPLS